MDTLKLSWPITKVKLDLNNSVFCCMLLYDLQVQCYPQAAIRNIIPNNVISLSMLSSYKLNYFAQFAAVDTKVYLSYVTKLRFCLNSLATLSSICVRNKTSP